MKSKPNDKTRIIRTAAIIAIAGNMALSLIKIITGLISGSGALVSDGIDSSADVLISVITLVVVKVISKPADAEHPWGHGRAETVMTALLSFILFFMGAQLVFGAVTGLFSGEAGSAPSFHAAVAAVVSIVGKIALARVQYVLGKRAGSPMIAANAKNMAGDAVVSAGVLVGLIISAFTGSSFADTAISGLIGIWIIKTAIGIFLEANRELMDGNKDSSSYRIVRDAANSVEGAYNPHHARIRKIAGFWDIVLDINVDPLISVSEAHVIASKVEDEIRRRLGDVYDIMLHVEPLCGDAEHEHNAYGWSEEMMKNP